MNTKPPSIPDPKTLSKPAKREFWLKQVKSFEESELSGEAYCRKHSLTHRQFRYWREKLSTPTKKPSKTGRVVPVKLTPFTQQNNRTLCTLRLANGNELNIYDISVLPVILEGGN